VADVIRTVHIQEFTEFARLLDRSYGESVGAFERMDPRLYRPTAEACACFHVLEHDGRIVSHVGIYPIEVLTSGVELTIGGIGAVATVPEERRHGYMSTVLRHVVEVMRERHYPLSWLGGDRQRYNAFGWELAGITYHITLSRRSLDRAGIEPVPVQEVFPWEAEPLIERLQSMLICRARRPDLGMYLRKQGLRVWVADDGYLITSAGWGKPFVAELASTSENELGLIRGAMEWASQDKARCVLSMWDQKRLARLLPAASDWDAHSDGMYRIIDLYPLMAAAQPLLERRAAGLRDMDLCFEIREPDRVDAVTLEVSGGHVRVTPGRHSAHVIELTSIAAARLLLGGAPIGDSGQMPSQLAALLPIPVHVPPLSDV
jgi:predicted N-acetyltransferase YhbS